MNAPVNQVAVQGTTVATADYLNSLVQWVPDLVHLRQFIGVQGMAVILLGYVSQNDGGQGAYFWDTGSVATDDNVNVIRPSGLTVGAWIRVTLTAEVVITSGVTSFNTRTGAVTLTSADVGATVPTFVSNVGVNGDLGVLGTIDVNKGLGISGPIPGVPPPPANLGGTPYALGVNGSIYTSTAGYIACGYLTANYSGSFGGTLSSTFLEVGQNIHAGENLWVGHYASAAGGIVTGTGNVDIGGSLTCQSNMAVWGWLAVGTGTIGNGQTYIDDNHVYTQRLNCYTGVAYLDLPGGAHGFELAWDQGAGHLNFHVDGTIRAFLTTNSDARLKNVIGNYTGGTAVIKQIQPVQFTWNNADPLYTDHTTVHVGVVAQALEAIPGGPYPDLITQGPGVINGGAVTDLRQVNAVQLVFPLINAVKELDGRLTAINATSDGHVSDIAALQEEMVALQDEMKSLQAEMKSLQAALKAARAPATKPAPPSPPKPGKKKR